MTNFWFILLRRYLLSLVGESGATIGGLGRSVGRGVVDRLLGADMVVGKVMLSVSLIAIVPLQLGLECVVLLGEVLLPVVVGVAPPVAPLKGVWCGHIDVLEVVVPGVGSVRPGLGEGDAPGSSGSWGLRPGEGGH